MKSFHCVLTFPAAIGRGRSLVLGDFTAAAPTAAASAAMAHWRRELWQDSPPLVPGTTISAETRRSFVRFTVSIDGRRCNQLSSYTT